MMDEAQGGSELRRLAAEIRAELDRVESSQEPTGFVEPEVEEYQTRLHSLRDAVAVMEVYEEDLDQA